MQLFRAAESESKRHAEEQEMNRRLLDARALVEKREREARESCACLMKEISDIEAELGMFHVKRQTVLDEMAEIETQREALQSSTLEIKWMREKEKAEAKLAEVEARSIEIETESSYLAARQKKTESRIALAQDKLDQASYILTSAEVRERKSKVLAESLASQDKELTKRIAEFAAEREAGLAEITTGKGVNRDMAATLETDRAQLAKGWEELTAERRHLESQQTTLRLAFEEARSKNLL